MQQERLRALGQMASGIAHDINNAISPISLYTESLLEREKGLSAPGRGQLQVIQRAIGDVAQTVARMREFYRPREPQMMLARVHLNELVQQVLDLTRVRWNDMPQQRGVTIALAKDLARSLPPVMGAESEIREALTNLVFNAVDAMPEGGTLTLRTRAEEGRVHVEVIDTGIGMDEDARRRCLEPFFTTKGERGTGLGLAMVYGMVQRHSADISIDSELGKGTRVQLTFGAAVADAPVQVATPVEVPTGLQSAARRRRSRAAQVTARCAGGGRPYHRDRQRRTRRHRDVHRGARERAALLRGRDRPRHALCRRTPGCERGEIDFAELAGDPAHGLGPAAAGGRRSSRARGPGARQAAAIARAARSAGALLREAGNSGFLKNRDSSASSAARASACRPDRIPIITHPCLIRSSDPGRDSWPACQRSACRQ